MIKLAKFFNSKIVFLLFTIIYLLLGKAFDVNASDFQIICDSNGCSGLSGPIFDEVNILPGDNFEKSINITNNKDEDLKVSMKTILGEDPDNIFLGKLNIVSSLNSVIIYNGDFSGFLNEDYDLGDLEKGDDMEINFKVLFPQNSGNEYQGKSFNFDIKIIFIGKESGNTEVVNTNSSNEGTSGNNESDNDTQGEVLGTSTYDQALGKILGLSDTNKDIQMFYYLILVLIYLIMIITLRMKLKNMPKIHRIQILER